MRQYVLSRTLVRGPDPGVEIISTDPRELVRTLKRREDGLDICLIGGARAAGVLLPEIDELLIKRYPVVAGAGLPMFAGTFAPNRSSTFPPAASTVGPTSPAT